MQYEEIVPISRDDAAAAFQNSDDTYTVCHSLLCVALHEEDWRWALPHVLRFMMHPNPEVRGVAVTCVGYLARIHRTIDVSQVLPLLDILREDPYCARRVRDALEDIRQFTRAA
jgi:hypothetical protein